MDFSKASSHVAQQVHRHPGAPERVSSSYVDPSAETNSSERAAAADHEKHYDKVLQQSHCGWAHIHAGALRLIKPGCAAAKVLLDKKVNTAIFYTED
jgi:hypothetical protein